MPLITGNDAKAIAVALAKAGGMWTPYYRQPTDANGVATGDPVRTGCLLGKTYIKGSASTVRIDIPGVTAMQSVTRFEGILAGGCATPRTGDLLSVDGAHVKIMSVYTEGAPLIVMTLDL